MLFSWNWVNGRSFLAVSPFSTYTHYHTSLAGNEIVRQRMGYFHSCTQASHLSYLSLSLCSECLNEVFLHARFIYFLFIDNVAFFPVQYKRWREASWMCWWYYITWLLVITGKLDLMNLIAPGSFIFCVLAHLNDIYVTFMPKTWIFFLN